MSRVVITENAALDLERCRCFLAKKDRLVARKAGQAIEKRFASLATKPQSDRPLTNYSQLRELIIAFGNTGYIALYHYDADADCVLILAFRHQKKLVTPMQLHKVRIGDN